jgi:hypothetical protein
MRQILIFIITVLSLIEASVVVGQTVDTNNSGISAMHIDTLTTINHSAEIDESDDFAPGLLFIALIGIAFILVCVGCGIALTVIALLIIAIFISLGILSTSIIVGLNKKSFTTGFKTFIVLTSSIGGILLGGISFWGFNQLVHWWTVKTAVLLGVICGFFGGLVFGILAFYILQRLTNYLKRKLNITDNWTVN